MKFRYVRERRPTIAPNFNFLGQLLEYEKSMNDHRHRRHKRQQSLTSLHSIGKLHNSHVMKQPSSLPKRTSTCRVHISHAASATGSIDEDEAANFAVSFLNCPEDNNISGKCPRLDSPTSAMARLSFDRSISVEVRLPISSQPIDISSSDRNSTPKGSKTPTDTSPLAQLLAKAAVASASAAANLNKLPLRTCVIDARLTSALSCAQQRAVTCAAMSGIAGPSFDSLLASLSNSGDVENYAAWRKTRSLDNMAAMLDPLIESPDRLPPTPTQQQLDRNQPWVVRAASADQNATSKVNGQTNNSASLLCSGSGNVSPASSSLSLHSVCSSTTEIAA